MLSFPLVALLAFLRLWASPRGQQFSVREGSLLRKFKCRPSAEIPRWEWPSGGVQGTLVSLSKEN